MPPAPLASSGRRTLGIDEAGRGPSIGPMVIAVVALDTKAASHLSRHGVTDSKAFVGTDAHARRSELATLVRKLACHVGTAVIDAETIDHRVARGELNLLERETAARLIADADAAGAEVTHIIADGKTLFAALGRREPRLVARDRAEAAHAAVAAASMVAKVLRDEWVQAYCAGFHVEFGPITGGGYVNAGTRRFIRAYAEKHGALPPHTRRSWPHAYLADVLPAAARTMDTVRRPQVGLFDAPPLLD